MKGVAIDDQYFGTEMLHSLGRIDGDGSDAALRVDSTHQGHFSPMAEAFLVEAHGRVLSARLHNRRKFPYPEAKISQTVIPCP